MTCPCCGGFLVLIDDKTLYVCIQCSNFTDLEDNRGG
jgi:hypothetical protein